MKSFSINKQYFRISGHQQSWQQHFPFFVFFCFLNEQQQPGQKPRGPLGAPVTGPSWCSGRRWALGTSPGRAGGRQQMLTVLPAALGAGDKPGQGRGRADADSAARVPEAARRAGGQTRGSLEVGGRNPPRKEPCCGAGTSSSSAWPPRRPGLGSIQGRPSPPLGTAGQVAPTPAASV